MNPGKIAPHRAILTRNQSMRSGKAHFHYLHRSLAIVALLGLALAPATSVRAGSHLEWVTLEAREGGHGYAVRLHTDTPVQGYREPRIVDGGVIEIVLLNVSRAPGFDYEAPPQGPFRSIDVVSKDGNVAVRIQLHDVLPLAATAYRHAGTSDLMLDITYLGGETIPLADTGPPVQVASEDSAAPVARQRWKLDTVVIDAGHGGKDTGATAYGIREKDVTLAVALRLGQLIEERLGCKVVFTRDDDRFVELHERGYIANEAGGRLFVSLHANAATSSEARGTETYFLGMHKTEAARHVMERENSVVAFESNPDHYQDFGESGLIMRALAQSAYMRKSEELAGLVESALQDRAGRASRGVKQAGFYVLWSASMPSVLVELGFITNRSEAAFLASEYGQDDLASAIFRAIREFKEQYERDIDLAEVN